MIRISKSKSTEILSKTVWPMSRSSAFDMSQGILVTTATYGSDAYEFAKGKPLTLLNGSNLLHLLEKHGHHAKIDLKEAKRILAEKDKQ